MTRGRCPFWWTAFVLDVFVNVMVPVWLVALVASVAGQRLGLHAEPFSRATFWLFSPALVFTSMLGIDMQGAEVGRIIAVALVVFVVNLGAAAAWCRWRGTDQSTIGIQLLASTSSNQGNLGLPIATLAFGAAGLKVAVVVWIVGVVLQSSAGFAVACYGHLPWRRALLAPLRYPAIHAAAAGVALNLLDVSLPKPLMSSVSTLAVAAIPTMLVVLGLQLHVPRRGQLLDPVATGVNRLFVGPAVAWPVATLLGLVGTSRAAMVVQCAMPTAVMVTVIAGQVVAGRSVDMVEADEDVEINVTDERVDLAVRTVVVSTLMSLVTLTVLVSLVR
jgi:predicted permease